MPSYAPPGEFMTGYAVIEVNKGKISTIESDDIYKLDERFPKRISAPDPIKNITPTFPIGICAIKISLRTLKFPWIRSFLITS